MAENKPFKFLQRQRIALFLAAAFLIAAVACGGSATPEPGEAPAQAAATEKPVEPTAVPPTSVPTAIPEIADRPLSFPWNRPGSLRESISPW